MNSRCIQIEIRKDNTETDQALIVSPGKNLEILKIKSESIIKKVNIQNLIGKEEIEKPVNDHVITLDFSSNGSDMHLITITLEQDEQTRSILIL